MVIEMSNTNFIEYHKFQLIFSHPINISYFTSDVSPLFHYSSTPILYHQNSINYPITHTSPLFLLFNPSIQKMNNPIPIFRPIFIMGDLDDGRAFFFIQFFQ